MKKCGFGCTLTKGLSKIGNHVQNNWRKYLSWGSFAACMVVSGGTCLAIGLVGAAITAGADVLDPRISWRRAAGGDHCRRPVKWGYVSRVVTVRASVRSGVCAATSCALYG